MNEYSIILLLTAFVNGFLAFYSLKHRKSTLTLSYFGFMIGVALYSLGYAFEIAAKDITSILFWLKIQYIGIPFFPSFYLLFTLRFTGREKWISKKLYLVLFSISSLTLFFHYTNLFTSFYTHFEIRNEGQLVVANFTKGIWYWVHQLYSNFVIAFCIVLYTIQVIKEKYVQYKIRSFLMLLSSIVPWPVYLYYLSGKSPGGIDLNPFSFSIVGVLGAIAMFRYHLLDFVPLAIESAFESINDAIIILDIQNHIRSFNMAAQKLFPKLNEDSKGKNFMKIFAPFNDLKCLVKSNTESKIDLELYPLGVEKYFQVNLSLVKDSNKQVIGRTLIFTDITNIKMTENCLKENEKSLKALNATKDKFFTIIAHDLRNPFNALTNLSDFLVEKIENDSKEEALNIARMMNQSAKVTYALLQNLLEWSKIQRGLIKANFETFDIKGVIESEIDPLKHMASQKKISLKLSLETNFRVIADRNMIKTIIRNLISNAIKYSFEQSEILISSFLSNNYIVIFIKDTGTGMTEEDQQRLFKIENSASKAGTNHEQGTGLGLLLCKEFVEINNGKIWIESEPGKGSIFYFSLPKGE